MKDTKNLPNFLKLIKSNFFEKMRRDLIHCNICDEYTKKFNKHIKTKIHIDILYFNVRLKVERFFYDEFIKWDISDIDFDSESKDHPKCPVLMIYNNYSDSEDYPVCYEFIISDIDSDSEDYPDCYEFIISDIDSDSEDENKSNYKMIRMYYLKYDIYVQMNMDSPGIKWRSLLCP